MDSNTSNTSLLDIDVSGTGMENNTLNVSMVGSGLSGYSDMLLVSGAFIIVCLWIIVLNGLLILCFWMNKSESWFAHSKNILSIIIIDLLVGFTYLMTFLNSMRIDINRYECLVSMGSCLASQMATSLNVLRFCVMRFYAISKSSLKLESTTSTVVAQTLSIWIVSVAITIVPLALWSEKESVLKRCAWDYLFPNHQYEVDIYIFNLLTIPTVTTTVLYGILSLKLRKIRNFVHPFGRNTSKPLNSNHWRSDTKITRVQGRNTKTEASSTRKDWISDKNCDKSDLLSASGKEWEMKTICKNCIDDSNTKTDKSTNVNAHQCFSVSKEFSTQTRQIFPETPGNQLTVPARNTRAKSASSVSTVSPMVNRRTRIRRVRTTIGILLVFINLSNLPFIVLTAIHAINPAINFPAVIYPLALFFLMLNSACNAVVYAIRLKPLRVAFLGMFKNCRHNRVSNS